VFLLLTFAVLAGVRGGARVMALVIAQENAVAEKRRS
jgi:hypothetical protein